MKIRLSRPLMGIIGLVLAALACSLPGSGALLEDNFSDSDAWGTGTDADSSVEYANDMLNFVVNKDLYFVWSTPNGEDYESIHMEVTASNNSTDSAAAFGLICNLQITNTSYYFAVTGAGEYAIGKYTFAGDTLLTNDGQWGTSSLIAADAPSYRIGADCGNNTLTLYVDGQQIDSVSDSTYTSGNVGVFAWSGEELNGTDVSFDDFVLTKLP
ncbi:MAG TPA: hypothetical protein VFG81_17720 [Anaerolineales bacterium]|jgi:hypothetical protein|nr:hypothetical protein [Anaerolineales bacterium]